MKAFGVVAIVAVFGVAYLFVSDQDYKEAVAAQSEYCEMVQLFKDTHGEAGWPAYNGEAMCK